MTKRSFGLRMALVCAGMTALPAAAQQNPTPRPVLRVPNPAPVRLQPRPIQRVPQVQQREIVPPAEVSTRQTRPSVTLRAGPDSATIRSLRVKRQMPLAQVRAAPVFALGRARVNMAPVLGNQRALFNVAQRMREQPALTEVLADDTQFYEIDQGLIIRSFLTYRIKPGVCSGPSARGVQARTGVSCATAYTDASRAAAFANPRDPHYVADARRRGAAVAEARAKSAVVDAELNKQVADIRASLADPARRGGFVTELGAAEAARLATLTDDQLKSEIVNSGETSIEQTMFVPGVDKGDTLTLSPAALQLMGKHTTLAWSQMPPLSVNKQLEQRIFLTGFTLGRDYEWKQRVETTIKMCLVGCKKTYFAEVFAGFGYGFGLRFPIQLGGTYDYQAGAAKVTTTFSPINGNEAQYAATGLAGDKLFGGKELVAQVTAHAGAAFNLPFVGSNSIDVPIKLDFTEYLGGDFANGQFTPPAPGAANPPKMEKIFDTLDLIGGRANFGILGAQVFPAVRVELTSDSLTFKLHDFIRNSDTLLSSSGQVTTLGVDPNDKSSRFSIGDPAYNLGFTITPGINARLFIDIAVWSHNWDLPVWFPQLAITLPPDGVTFGCHEGTVCSRNYRYSPTGQSESDGASGAFELELETWGNNFDAKWLPECSDETCQIGIRFVRLGTILSARQKHNANGSLTMASFAGSFAQAESQAKELVTDSQIRQTQKASNSFGILAQAVWSKRCSDKICLDKVKGITAFYVLEINAQQKQHPEKSTQQILGEVGKKFAPVYQAEIDASKARAAAAEAAAKPPLKLVPQPTIRFNGLPKKQ